MNPFLVSAAQALVEHCDGRSEPDIAAAIDATLDFFSRQGFSVLALRSFQRAVKRELRRGRRTIPARLRTPQGRSGAAAQAIAVALERRLGRTIELAEDADPSLLGGAVLTVEDERFDASIHGALRHLAEHLAAPMS